MNGASVDIFPGSQSPLNVMALLVNYPQTRKSQNTKLCKALSEKSSIRPSPRRPRTLQLRLVAMPAKTMIADGGSSWVRMASARPPKQPRVRLASAAISSFTPEVRSFLPTHGR